MAQQNFDLRIHLPPSHHSDLRLRNSLQTQQLHLTVHNTPSGRDQLRLPHQLPFRVRCSDRIPRLRIQGFVSGCHDFPVVLGGLTFHPLQHTLDRTKCCTSTGVSVVGGDLVPCHSVAPVTHGCERAFAVADAFGGGVWHGLFLRVC